MFEFKVKILLTGGGHVVCTLWARQLPREIWARAGGFILTEGAEMEALRAAMPNVRWEPFS